MINYKYDKEYYNVYNEVSNEKSIIFITHSTRRVETLFKIKFHEWSLLLFLEVDKILEQLKPLHKTAVISILAVIKRWLLFKKHKEHRIYTEYSNKINETYKFLHIDRVDTYKKSNNSNKWIDIDILKNKLIDNFKNIKVMKYIKLRNHLLLSFYIFIEPTRLGNLEYLKYIKNPTQLLKNENKNYNYIAKIDNVYHITYNRFKTCKFLKQQNLIIDNKYLVELLDCYLSRFGNNLDNTENHYMFYQGYHFQKNIDNVSIGAAIPKIIYEYMNIKGIHINEIRHSFFKRFYATNPSIEEQKDISYKTQILFNPSNALMYNSL